MINPNQLNLLINHFRQEKLTWIIGLASLGPVAWNNGTCGKKTRGKPMIFPAKMVPQIGAGRDFLAAIQNDGCCCLGFQGRLEKISQPWGCTGDIEICSG